MRLKDYKNKDGKKVWLSKKEISMLLEQAETPHQKIAFLLGVRSGLRRDEIMQIEHRDIRKTTIGHVVRVWEGKGDKYREPPTPTELVHIAETLGMDRELDDTLLDVDESTVYRWVKKAGEKLHAETGDRGWLELGPHDLRRSWGVQLLEQGVLPSVVMEWGGWEDWDTFKEHYMNEFSPESLRRECGKVDFLSEGRRTPDTRC